MFRENWKPQHEVKQHRVDRMHLCRSEQLGFTLSATGNLLGFGIN